MSIYFSAVDCAWMRALAQTGPWQPSRRISRWTGSGEGGTKVVVSPGQAASCSGRQVAQMMVHLA